MSGQPAKPEVGLPPDADWRASMLDAIRGHLAASAGSGASSHAAAERAAPPPASDQAAGAAPPESQATMVRRFAQAVESVAGHAVWVRDVDEAAAVVLSVLERHQCRRVVVSDAPLVRQVIAAAKPDAEIVEEPDRPALFACDAGITSAQWAVAETGTLVLDSDAERHRLASLVPPVHIALVEATAIRGTLGEVIAALAARGTGGMSRAVTCITGPSRTSDIELTLAIGVHGPGQLHVVVIGGQGDRDEHER